MTTYDVGDQALLQHEVRVAGVLTDATVVLAVTAPDGTASTPAVTHASTGVYTASVPVAQAGPWVYVWTMSGAVVDVAVGMFSGQNPTTPVYATPAQVKSYTGISDANSDSRIADVLAGVSREIDGHTHRRFYADLTATARRFTVENVCAVELHDFWTTTGLVVEADYGGDGTFETTYTTADYELYPTDGIVDGETGWPYNEIRAVNQSFPCQRLRPGLRVTAKWGWAAVPPSVHEACLILAAETLKLPDSVFGTGGYSEFGVIRVRDNPMAARKLARYVRDPVLVA